MSDGWVPCCIEGCERKMGVGTYRKRFKAEPGTWICSTHWGRATKVEKRVLARLKRLERRHGIEAMGKGLGNLRRRLWRSWDAVLRRVAE